MKAKLQQCYINFTHLNQVDLKLQTLKSYTSINGFGFIYLIEYQNDSLIKIGITNNLHNRIKSLKTQALYMQNPIKSIYISHDHTNYIDNEKILHLKFTQCRVNSTELFNIKISEVVDFADKLTFNKKISKNIDRAYDLKTGISSLKKSYQLYTNIEIIEYIDFIASNLTETKKTLSKLQSDEINHEISRDIKFNIFNFLHN